MENDNFEMVDLPIELLFTPLYEIIPSSCVNDGKFNIEDLLEIPHRRKITLISEKHGVGSRDISSGFYVYRYDDFNKTWFLNKELAYKKLKELRKEYDC